MMNLELTSLFQADQTEARDVPDGSAPHDGLRGRDAARRARVVEIVAERDCVTREDYYHAAMILHHGEAAADALAARDLARTAAYLGYRPARWLTAAALDRYRLLLGLPQVYGTQIVPDGDGYRLWDVEPGTTDVERARWDVPPRAELERRAAELGRSWPVPPLHLAPRRFQEALDRLARESA